MRVRAAAGAEAERVVAEAFEAGLSGVEERVVEECEAGGDILLVLYAPAARAAAVREAALRVLGDARRLGPTEPVEPVDWVARARQAQRATVVSRRLVVRPSFVSLVPAPGQRELLIDPGQAFGTGSHESTLLALRFVDALTPELGAETQVLDVGTGSGVLALAALKLGAGRAVGVEIERAAAREAAAAARQNGLAERFRVIAGSLDALGSGHFDLVLANLLKRELLPQVEALAALCRGGGRLVVSGLLAPEQIEVAAALAAVGFDLRARRDCDDASGERWVALLMTRRSS